MKNLLDYQFLIPLVLLPGFAPFYPQPHIVEKLRMLLAGTLKKPIDIFRRDPCPDLENSVAAEGLGDGLLKLH